MIPFNSKPTLRLFLFLLFLAVCSAQPLLAARKEALLIANSRYSHFPGLPNSLSDAAKLRAALEKIGFRVRLVSNASKEQMDDAVRDFENQLRNTGAIAFFHYGGHGVQVDGKNYLIPSDAEIPDENRVSTRSLPLEEVMAAMAAAATRASIVVVDACRDNPLPATSDRSMARGLSVVEQKPNIIVIFSAQAGRIAKDGLFTPILANAIQTPGRTIEQIMKTVRTEVYQKSGRTQTPVEYNQLFEDFFLWDGRGDDPMDIFSTPTPNSNQLAYNTAKAPVENFESFDIKMILVEGGNLRDRAGLIVKAVSPFWIGQTEVTWQEWQKVREWAAKNGYDIGNVGIGGGNNYPVHNINWHDSVKWCNALSEIKGLEPVYKKNGKVYRSSEFNKEDSAGITLVSGANGYRLPAALEWEFAAQGGIKSQGYSYSGGNNLNGLGWFKDNTISGPNVVALKAANELGLYDMSGNVWEWCWDSVGAYRHIRGGSWDSFAESCSVFFSDSGYPYYRIKSRGIRLARSFEP